MRRMSTIHSSNPMQQCTQNWLIENMCSCFVWHQIYNAVWSLPCDVCICLCICICAVSKCKSEGDGATINLKLVDWKQLQLRHVTPDIKCNVLSFKWCECVQCRELNQKCVFIFVVELLRIPKVSEADEEGNNAPKIGLLKTFAAAASCDTWYPMQCAPFQMISFCNNTLLRCHHDRDGFCLKCASARHNLILSIWFSQSFELVFSTGISLCNNTMITMFFAFHN